MRGGDAGRDSKTLLVSGAAGASLPRNRQKADQEFARQFWAMCIRGSGSDAGLQIAQSIGRYAVQHGLVLEEPPSARSTLSAALRAPIPSSNDDDASSQSSLSSEMSWEFVEQIVALEDLGAAVVNGITRMQHIWRAYRIRCAPSSNR